MYTELIRGITIRPLRNGQTEVVQAVFDRLGPGSRQLRFAGGGNALSAADLAHLGRVDGTHHVLVAYVDGTPAGIARLVRDGMVADVTFAVVDDFQGKDVGRALSQRLSEDARAAGIEMLRASMSAENDASLALLKRMTIRLRVRLAAGQLEVIGPAA